jgi:hypothetical protein
MERRPYIDSTTSSDLESRRIGVSIEVGIKDLKTAATH